MTENEARTELDAIAASAFAANISNPDKMAMDNSRFVDMHVNQIKKESRGGWNYSLADRYVGRLSHMMRRD